MKKSLGINAILNVIKQISGILFPLIVFPYVSRTLSSTNYGKYSFSLSVISYFLLVANMGIPTYAVREGARIRDDKAECNKFVNEVYTINTIFTLLSYVCLVGVIFYVKDFKNYRVLVIIQSFGLLLSLIGSDWVNQIYEDYRFITIRTILFQILTLIPIFLFVRDVDDYVIYTAITVVGTYGGNLINIFYIRRYVDRKLVINCNFRKHIIPILVLFSGILAMQIYVSSDITMLGFMRSESEVGVYSSVSRIYNIVKQTINAITVVSIPRIVSYLKEQTKEQYNRLINSMLNILMLIVVPATIGLFLLSEDVILIICGEEYIAGTAPLKILSLTFPFSVLATLFVNAVLVPNRKEFKAFVCTLIAAIVNFILNFAFIKYWGISGAAITTLIAEFIVLALSLLYSFKDFKIEVNKKDLVSMIISNLLVWAMCLLCQNISNIYFRVIATVFSSVLVYAISLTALRNTVAVRLIEILKLR